MLFVARELMLAQSERRGRKTHRELTAEACTSITGFLKCFHVEERVQEESEKKVSRTRFIRCTPEVVKNILMCVYLSFQPNGISSRYL